MSSCRTRLNANNLFNNQNGVKISPAQANQFGGTLGGPIKKDKTFFFMDYQGTIARSTGTARAGVPSVAERHGDFGELCSAAGGTFDAAGSAPRQRSALGSDDRRLHELRAARSGATTSRLTIWRATRVPAIRSSPALRISCLTGRGISSTLWH